MPGWTDFGGYQAIVDPLNPNKVVGRRDNTLNPTDDLVYQAELIKAKATATDGAAWRTKERESITGINTYLQRNAVLDETIEGAINKLNSWTAGYGSYAASLPASDARSLSNLLQTVKANIGFSELLSLKASGGTLGALSETELEMLQAVWGTLDQRGKFEDIVKVLRRIQNVRNSSYNGMTAAYWEDRRRYGSQLEEPTFKAWHPDPTVVPGGSPVAPGGSPVAPGGSPAATFKLNGGRPPVIDAVSDDDLINHYLPK
jgi:hypothetical protein